jgi:sugar lactone lactonase YvrE
MLPKPLLLVLSAAVYVGCTPDSPQTTQPDEPTAADEPAATAQPAESAPAASDDWPDRVVAERGGFVPEGIAYDGTHQRFLVGSIAEGTIFEIHADGSLTPVVEDRDLTATIGIRVDEQRDRLLAANSDASVFQGAGPGQARLGVFALGSGERIAMVDLAAVIEDAPEDGMFFANDVAVGPDGTAYVTDSFMHVVYAVDTDYRASVLHRFEPGEDGLMLNGIAVHPDGYLLVADSPSGGLIKVPLDEPEAALRVEMSEPVPGADGIVWQADNRLAVVSNSTNRVVVLSSGDGWASAQVAAEGTFGMQGTTAAVRDGEIYVVQPVFAGEEVPVVERVTLQ